MVKTTTIDKEHFDSVLLELIKVVKQKQGSLANNYNQGYGRYTKYYYRLGKYCHQTEVKNTFCEWDYKKIARNFHSWFSPCKNPDNNNFEYEKWIGDLLQIHDKDTWNSYISFLKHDYPNETLTDKELYGEKYGLISFLLNPISLDIFKNAKRFGRNKEYMKNNYHTMFWRDKHGRSLVEKTIDLPRSFLNFQLKYVKYPKVEKGLSANYSYGKDWVVNNSHYKIDDLKEILKMNKIPFKGVTKYMDLVNIIKKELP
jgi:hypothetical protein